MLETRGVKDEAVVNYREPLTSLCQGFGLAGNKGDTVFSTFPTWPPKLQRKREGKKQDKLNGLTWSSHLVFFRKSLESRQDPCDYCFAESLVMFYIQR